MSSAHRAAAVVGRPIAHSLSPVLHRAAYDALGPPWAQWTYTAIDTDAAGLAGVLAERSDWAGVSCTMPCKHAALELAAEVTPVAAAIGAANTLLPLAAGWRADNTDAAGIMAALAEHGVQPRRVAVLGAGGTAQAALAALHGLGVPDVLVLARAPERAGTVRATAERLQVPVAVAPLHPTAPGLDADLVISTLPPGAADVVGEVPWHDTQVVFDVVYAGWPTPLATAAAARGAKVISGATMLLHQAAVQVTLMTGRPAPVPAMRAALLAAAPGCGA